VSKTKYSVEIVFTTIDRDEICRKEIEYIAKYGRRDLCTGTLANLTDGGEETFQMSKESVDKIVITNRKLGTYDKNIKYDESCNDWKY
jgi:hypothetical protein